MFIPCGQSNFINENSIYENKPGFYNIINLKFSDDKNKSLKPVLEFLNINGVRNWTTNNFINETYLTNYDIEYLKINFGLYDFQIKRALISSKDINSNLIFNKYINILFKAKEEQDILKDLKSENYNAALRETIKLFLNAISGKMVEDPTTHKKLIFTDDETNLNICGQNVKQEKNDGINNLLVIGVLIYSYSKRLLFEYINQIGSENIIHIETDGIYY
jgi:hypothetical protein